MAKSLKVYVESGEKKLVVTINEPSRNNQIKE